MIAVAGDTAVRMKFGVGEELPALQARLLTLIDSIRSGWIREQAGIEYYAHNELNALGRLIEAEPQASDASLLRCYRELRLYALCCLSALPSFGVDAKVLSPELKAEQLRSMLERLASGASRVLARGGAYPLLLLDGFVCAE